MSSFSLSLIRYHPFHHEASFGWVSLWMGFQHSSWSSSEIDLGNRNWGPFRFRAMDATYHNYNKVQVVHIHTLDWTAIGFYVNVNICWTKQMLFVYIIWLVYPLSTKFGKRCWEFYEFWFGFWHYTSFSQLKASYTLETSNLPWNNAARPINMSWTCLSKTHTLSWVITV